MAANLKVTRNTRTFTDIDLDFLAHPVTKDIVTKTNEEAVKRSVRNLIQLNFYEKPFHPEIGSGVRALLFEPATPIVGAAIESDIRNTLNNFEPRVRVLDVKVEVLADRNAFNATLTFMVLNVENPVTIDVFLERLR